MCSEEEMKVIDQLLDSGSCPVALLDLDILKRKMVNVECDLCKRGVFLSFFGNVKGLVTIFLTYLFFATN